jgi:indole-3-glycerol phosphate synthase
LATVRDEAFAVRASTRKHALKLALSNDGINVIGEFKRKSPSKGVIRNGCSAAEMTALYESGGAAAVSVLTEEDYFDGSLDDLRAVRQAITLPVLRKDFIIDEYQIYEAAAAGADALLLIVAALADDELRQLRKLAEDELGLDALVEVHTVAELQRALTNGASLIGVNNRDLRSFTVSLAVSIELARQVPPDVLLVSESGLQSREDLQQLRSLGYQGFLIGELLMRAPRPAEALRQLIHGNEV